MADGNETSGPAQEAGADTPAVTAAERLRQRREARRSKILAGGEARLGRITQTYASSAAADASQPSDPVKSAGDAASPSLTRPTSTTTTTMPSTTSSSTTTSTTTSLTSSSRTPVRLEAAEHHREPARSTRPPAVAPPSLLAGSGDDMLDDTCRIEQLLAQAMYPDSGLPSSPFAGAHRRPTRATPHPSRPAASLSDPHGIWAWLHAACITILAFYALINFSLAQHSFVRLGGADTHAGDSRSSMASTSPFISTLARAGIIDVFNGIAMLASPTAVDMVSNTGLSGTLHFTINNNISADISIWIWFLIIQFVLVVSQFLVSRIMAGYTHRQTQGQAQARNADGSPSGDNIDSGDMPDDMFAILDQFGVGAAPNLIRSAFGSFTDSMRIIRYFTDDVMLFVFVVGIGVSIASIVRQFNVV